jgi:hypothetical protein
MSLRSAAALGAGLWTAALLAVRPVLLGNAWPRLLLLLAALVLLPLGLDLVSDGEDSLPWRVVKVFQMPAALLLGVALFLPQGSVAAGLAFPWLLLTGAVALLGAWRLRRRDALSDICLNAASIYLAVGGAWAMADRLGLRPLAFDSAIVLLTAVHFHYAGFVLPLVTGLAIRQAKRGPVALAGVGVVAGVPLVAAGITMAQLTFESLVECWAAWLLAMAATATAALHIRLALQPAWPRLVRGLWTLSALSLVAGMTLAALYGSRSFLPWYGLDVPWMRALHGTANALGFALAGLVAWTLAPIPGRRPSYPAG